MDNSNSPNAQENTPRIPLGMSSFGKNEREQFGQNIRLAMECIEGTPEHTNKPAIPSDEASIRHRLKALSQEITSNHADLLELLVRFDDVQGWKYGGASHCAAWMNLEIGIGNVLHVNGHVGVEGNELADRMSIYAMTKHDTEFFLYPEKIDIDTILALRPG